jgi:hypothetical protein
LFVRTLWLAFLPFVVGLAGVRLLSWPLQVDALLYISAGLLFWGLWIATRPPAGWRALARRIDRDFRLRDQVSASVEVLAHRTDPNYVEGLLLADTTRMLAGIRQRLGWHQMLPWREVETLVLTAACLFALHTGIRPPTVVEAPAVVDLPPLGGEVADAMQRSPGSGLTVLGEIPGLDATTDPNGDAASQVGDSQLAAVADYQNAFKDLAAALEPIGAMNRAASALRQSDASEAASRLREFTDQYEATSRAMQADLARALEAAAQQDDVAKFPSLQQSLKRTADAAKGNDVHATSDQMQQLASLIQQMGAEMTRAQAQENAAAVTDPEGDPTAIRGSSSSSGINPIDSASEQRAGTVNQLPSVDGVPLEIGASSSGIGGRPANEPATATSMIRSGAGAGQVLSTGTSWRGVVRIGADLLIIPWRLRDVIQAYFSPRP